MLLAFWTISIAFGLARVIRFVVQDTWPPLDKLRTKLFLRFPPEGLKLNEPEEIAQITQDEEGYLYYKGYLLIELRENELYEVYKGHWLGDLFSCYYCFSGWAAIPAVFFWYFAGGTIVAAPFAAAGLWVPFTILAGWAGLWGASNYLVGRL